MKNNKVEKEFLDRKQLQIIMIGITIDVKKESPLYLMHCRMFIMHKMYFKINIKT